ncbi:super-infection exclusion protein B [Flavobacterium sp. MC2016-06]|uniref:super-infection exclusion protein B n=1 Tax=Flavobacterium sp. MC2016-06 TaxID=2676308 RepID=UPI0018ACCD11|nr:super-infection exclusion protein B [Flavobacterium sp. MC2016-06]MBU3857710.1 superinfection exclusion B family protein [Flavobacterium sp. MC2016-06]
MELKSFFDFTKLPTKIFIVISFVTGFFIFSTETLLKKFRFDKLEEYGAYIGIVFLFSTCLIILNLIIWIYNKIDFNIKLKKFKAEIKQTIKDLDHQEQSVIREFFIKGQSSISMPINDDVISGLLDKKILKMNRQINGSTVGYGMTFPLSIDNYVNKIITFEDINFIQNPSEQQKQYILNNRPSWVRDSWRY